MDTTLTGNQLMEMYGPGVTAKEWIEAGVEKTATTLYAMTHAGDGWTPLTRTQAHGVAAQITEVAQQS